MVVIQSNGTHAWGILLFALLIKFFPNLIHPCYACFSSFCKQLPFYFIFLVSCTKIKLHLKLICTDVWVHFLWLYALKIKVMSFQFLLNGKNMRFRVFHLYKNSLKYPILSKSRERERERERDGSRANRQNVWSISDERWRWCP